MKPTFKSGLTYRLTFRMCAHDGVDLIGEVRHKRAINAWDRFNAKMAAKANAAPAMAS